ncbi:hypothetical protein ACFLR7_00445 [Acidobacteriota bacterium]
MKIAGTIQLCNALKKMSLISIIAFGFTVLVVFCRLPNKSMFSDSSNRLAVAVNGSSEFQTIEGWGVTHHVWGDFLQEYPIPYQDAVNQVRSLGFEYAFIPSDPFELVNDNGNPNNYNWQSFNLQFGARDNDFFRNCKYLQDAGFKLVVSIYNYCYADWATDGPCEDKSGNHIRSFDPHIYDEVAEYWTALLLYAKNNHNLSFDYISIQNEPGPDGQMTYWTPLELAEGIKSLGKRLKLAGFDTKIIAPDDSTALGSRKYMQTLLLDPLATSYIARLAFHTYDGGYPNGSADDAIKGISDLAQDSLVINSGLSLWMTEWTGGRAPIEKALEYAKLIYNSHVYGNATNFFVWSSSPGQDGFFAAGVVNGKIKLQKYGHGISQYTKFVPPGSIRISADINSTSNVFVTSYKHNELEQFILVFINRNDRPITVRPSVANVQGLSNLDVICTSETLDAVYLGQVIVNGSSFSYDLSKRSITTFTGKYSKSKKSTYRR